MMKLSGEITEKDFPHKGILWRGWGDETLRIIQEKNRPVLLFVADTDPFVRPFLREIFKAMPANARLRQLLNDVYPALFIEANSVPPDLEALGAGSNYHVAVLSDANRHDRGPARPRRSRRRDRRNSRTSR